MDNPSLDAARSPGTTHLGGTSRTCGTDPLLVLSGTLGTTPALGTAPGTETLTASPTAGLRDPGQPPGTALVVGPGLTLSTDMTPGTVSRHRGELQRRERRTHTRLARLLPGCPDTRPCLLRRTVHTPQTPTCLLHYSMSTSLKIMGRSSGVSGRLGCTIRPKALTQVHRARPPRNTGCRKPRSPALLLLLLEEGLTEPQDSQLPRETETIHHEEPSSDPLVPGLSSSSSPDEAVAGTSSVGPPPIDLRAHQDLLRHVAQNMNLQAEEVPEVQDPVVDILSSGAPTRVALPFIRTIQANATTIWQSLASVLPAAQGIERKYMVPSKGYEYLCPPFSLLPRCTVG
ncbi:uncharacterized protein LOC127056501 [Gopherus flavomarginatus]|uniref:uncharacterized protein LOC127056501 n=1 Tax=Gopherus flavomarginatus TaxID=286002 RepID=UPI0021CBEBF7|nr:uncharacterized protein LOC127056501 [Gopherus flavomarginatus]